MYLIFTKGHSPTLPWAKQLPSLVSVESRCDVWLYSLRGLLWNIFFYFFHAGNFPFLGILVKLTAHWVGFLFLSLVPLFIQMTGLQKKDFFFFWFILFTSTTAKSLLFDDVLHVVPHWSPVSISSTYRI